MNPNLLALLPELILTVAGVLVMLAEPLLPAGQTRKPLGWLAILASIASGAAAWFQLHTVAQNHGISILAFSNTLQVDAYSVFFHLLIAATVAVSLLASLDFFDTTTGHAGEYFALVLFAATGMMLMTSATELLVVFIGLEISSIATYIMAGFRKGNAPGSESSLKYFLLGSFATAFFLYGIALAFGATASTSIPVIAARIATTDTPALAFLALGMILIGLGFKVSAAPFHVWTPDVYQGAPSPIVGLMSTAPKAAAFAVLLRICFVGFGPQQHRWASLLWVLAALSMTIGNLGALKQRNVKRMLAYSSIAHAGYLLAAFTAFPADGISAAAFYTAAYTAMTLGAFVVVTQLSGPTEHTRTLDDYTGAALRRPWLGALMAFFPTVDDRHPVHRRLLRQVLRFLSRSGWRPLAARRDRPAQLRPGLLLLPAPPDHDVRPASARPRQRPRRLYPPDDPRRPGPSRHRAGHALSRHPARPRPHALPPRCRRDPFHPHLRRLRLTRPPLQLPVNAERLRSPRRQLSIYRPRHPRPHDRSWPHPLKGLVKHCQSERRGRTCVSPTD